MTFEDEFDSLGLNPDPKLDKIAPLGWVPEAGDGPNPNIELQRFIDPRDTETASFKPFHIANSVLQIKADLIPAEKSGAHINHRRISSGLLMTKGWFRQQYGYFEARLKMPKGQRGNWPCFWLLPDNGAWPPEIDILEQIGDQTGSAYVTIHAAPYKGVGKTQLGLRLNTPSLSDEFHLFGVDWQPESIRYFIDRKLVWEVPPLNGLLSVIIDAGGEGYERDTKIKITGGGPKAIGAIATPVIQDGHIKSVRVENSGTGYIDTPKIEVIGRGNGAALVSVISRDPRVPMNFHIPMYIILNLSIGGKGSWTGESSLEPHTFPRIFAIDYVRAYRRKLQKSPPSVVLADAEDIYDELEPFGDQIVSRRREQIKELISSLSAFEGRFDQPHEMTWDGRSKTLLDAFDRFFISLNSERAPIFFDLKNIALGPFKSEELETCITFPTHARYRDLDNHLGFWANDDEEDPNWFIGFDDHNGIYGSPDRIDYRPAAGPFQQGAPCRGVRSGHLVASRGPVHNSVLFLDGQIWHTSAVSEGRSVPAVNTEIRFQSVKTKNIRTVHFGRRLVPDEAEFLFACLKNYFS